jgi:hypothetical protein
MEIVWQFQMQDELDLSNHELLKRAAYIAREEANISLYKFKAVALEDGFREKGGPWLYQFTVYGTPLEWPDAKPNPWYNVDIPWEKDFKFQDSSNWDDLTDCPKIAEYWVEVDRETKNPTGNVCWAYYPGDRPSKGYWVKVRETGENNQ